MTIKSKKNKQCNTTYGKHYNMANRLFIILLVVFMIGVLGGCNPHMTDIDATGSDIQNRPTVVCSGFSQYDWIRNILGEQLGNWNVIRLNEKGTDMHSYQPTAKDVLTIVNADLVIYTGGVSEEWIETIVTENPDFEGQAYCLLEKGAAKEEVTVEGMYSKGHNHEHEYEHAHDYENKSTYDHHDSADEEHGHKDLSSYDEHIWLSPANAITFCEELSQILSLLDKSHKSTYLSNSKNYVEQLSSLQEDYKYRLGNCSKNTLIFADRFPFLYLAEDFGLKYYAAFPGCSAETEANFDTIIFLADKLTECKLPALLITESSTDSMAKTIIKTSGISTTEIYSLNSLQSVTNPETTYLKVMEKNLEILEKVLS